MKVFKLNSTGTAGVVIPKELKALGYVVGVEIEWEVKDGIPMLKKAISSPPVEKVALATSQPTEAAEKPVSGV